MIAGAALAAGCSGAPDQRTGSTLDPITPLKGDVTDDAYVSSSWPSDTHGAEAYLVTGTASGNEHHSYIKVTVASVPSGATDVKAVLDVVSQTTLSATVDAHCGASSAWTGSSLTWNNQPGFASATLSSVSKLTAGATASFDVSKCVTGNGTFTIVLDQPSGAVAKYASLEAGAGGPALSVTYTSPPPPPPPPSGTVIFGMYNDTAIAPGAEGNTGKNFRDIAGKWFVGSKVNVHRVYDDPSHFPATYAKSGGGDDPANGNVSFLSVKSPGGDHAGVASGKYDAEIKTLAASIPAGTYFTMWHEPENDMPAADFVAMFKQFYKVAKAANGALQIGTVGMAYQWRPGSKTTAVPDDWYPGATSTDFLGVDAYDPGWSGAHSLDTEADFQRWYGWALGKGKPVVIPEYGIESDLSKGGFTDAQRATIIGGTMAYLAKQPQIKMVLYWNATSAAPGGQNFLMNPTTSEPKDDFPLSRAAWVAGIDAYGTTSTSY